MAGWPELAEILHGDGTCAWKAEECLRRAAGDPAAAFRDEWLAAAQTFALLGVVQALHSDDGSGVAETIRRQMAG
jgi:hypothetical protein